MSVDIEVQFACTSCAVPTEKQFENWISAVLPSGESAEVLIRLVDSEESRQLNARYRNLDKPTNVLSFPADLPQEVDLPLLGDIVICGPLVEAEAAAQGKSVESHWAHLTIHGLLHLRGYDHQEEVQAAEMETLETTLLRQLGFPDPYQ